MRYAVPDVIRAISNSILLDRMFSEAVLDWAHAGIP
jgi:hypothetical protein